jgi:hypothetical protein
MEGVVCACSWCMGAANQLSSSAISATLYSRV